MVLPTTYCQICSRLVLTNRKRFGGLCCNACAAFFERTSKIQQYIYCLHSHDCLILPTKAGAKCRKCRFRKCLEVGMEVPQKVEVTSSQLLAESTNFLQKSKIATIDTAKFDRMKPQNFELSLLMPIETKSFVENPKTSVDMSKIFGMEHQGFEVASQLPIQLKHIIEKMENTKSFAQFSATKVHRLIKSCAQYPELLISFLEDDNQHLLELDEAIIMDKNDETIINALTKIFSTHDTISLKELPCLLYAFTCFLKIIGLNENLQNHMYYLQNRQYQKYFVEECILPKEKNYELFKLCELCFSCY